MLPAYDRERELLPILLANERIGVRVDTELMRRDLCMYEQSMSVVDAWIRERLGVPDLVVTSTKDVAAALDASGVVTDWVITKSGKKSTAKDNMTPDMFNDKRVAQVLGYRSRLSTCLSTFIRPWLLTAEASGGIIYTNWNQVRQPKDGDSTKGTRTGRMSSNPNFQNIPKDLSAKPDGYEHPDFLSVPELPLIRKYVLPDDDNSLFIHRDYSQQELRILAHYEDGAFLKLYQDDPAMDVHQFVQEEILRITGVEYPRPYVKQVNFGIIYGMGKKALAKKINDTEIVAADIKAAQQKVLPGVKALVNLINKRGKNGLNITTWGGRHYFCEPPVTIKKTGAVITFEYKLLNYLIQGSAADITKQALINYDQMKVHGRFLITVHDEINISCPKEHAVTEMEILRKAMQMVKLDVILLSDGKMGTNWGTLKKYEDPVEIEA
jgi:DNA polymerase-1